MSNEDEGKFQTEIMWIWKKHGDASCAFVPSLNCVTFFFFTKNIVLKLLTPGWFKWMFILSTNLMCGYLERTSLYLDL